MTIKLCTTLGIILLALVLGLVLMGQNGCMLECMLDKFYPQDNGANKQQESLVTINRVKVYGAYDYFGPTSMPVYYLQGRVHVKATNSADHVVTVRNFDCYKLEVFSASTGILIQSVVPYIMNSYEGEVEKAVNRPLNFSLNPQESKIFICTDYDIETIGSIKAKLKEGGDKLKKVYGKLYLKWEEDNREIQKILKTSPKKLDAVY